MEWRWLAVECGPQRGTRRGTHRTVSVLQQPDSFSTHPVLGCLSVLLGGLPFLALNGTVSLRCSPVVDVLWMCVGGGEGTAGEALRERACCVVL